MSGERTYVCSSRPGPTLEWHRLPIVGARDRRRVAPWLATLLIFVTVAALAIWGSAA